MTTYLKYEERLQFIIYLIERKRTGSPQELANKLGISKRTIKRMIRILRIKGKRIVYSRSLRSYKFLTD